MATNIVHNTETFARKSAESRAQSGAGRIEVPLDRIRDRAYFIFLARGGKPGNPESDWAQAEKELRAEVSRKQPNEFADAARASPRSTGAGNPAVAGGPTRRNPVMFSGG